MRASFRVGELSPRLPSVQPQILNPVLKCVGLRAGGLICKIILGSLAMASMCNRSQRLVARSLFCGAISLAPLAASAGFKDPAVIVDNTMSETISQTQNLMRAISNGCSGGRNGEPPVSWDQLSKDGDAVLNQLSELRIALARNQTDNAVPKINAIETGLDTIINHLHENCSGGSHGVDPPNYGGYRNLVEQMKGKLDVIKNMFTS
jgi:hypothetical protein